MLAGVEDLGGLAVLDAEEGEVAVAAGDEVEEEVGAAAAGGVDGVNEPHSGLIFEEIGGRDAFEEGDESAGEVGLGDEGDVGVGSLGRGGAGGEDVDGTGAVVELEGAEVFVGEGERRGRRSLRGLTYRRGAFVRGSGRVSGPFGGFGSGFGGSWRVRRREVLEREGFHLAEGGGFAAGGGPFPGVGVVGGAVGVGDGGDLVHFRGQAGEGILLELSDRAGGVGVVAEDGAAVERRLA